MCSIDLDPCEVWRETEHKARKPHRCDCCGNTIHIGDKYLSHFSKFDVYVTSQKICLNCDRDRRAFGDAHESMKCVPSAFTEALSDCISEGDEESMTKWAPMLAEIRARGSRQ